jgi:glycine cleavage system H protein
MAEISGIKVPEDLFYHPRHHWVRPTGNTAEVGIDDLARVLLVSICQVEMPEVGQQVIHNEEIGLIESGKWTSKIVAPLSGTITAINEAVRGDPDRVVQDPYGGGWLYRLEIVNREELNDLLFGDQALSWMEAEVKKYAP